MIPDLRDIWAQDRNNDGIVDYLNARIYVPDNPSPEELAAAANIAARLAFETTSLDLPLGFPVSAHAPGDAVAIFVGRAAGGKRSGPRSVLLPVLADAEAFARRAAMRGYVQRKPQGPTTPEPKRLSLAAFFTQDLLLRDDDSDFLPERVNTTIALGPDVRSTAVIDLAARLALEATGLSLPLVVATAAATPEVPPPFTVLVGSTHPAVTKMLQAGKLLPLEAARTGRLEIVDSCVVIRGSDPEGEDEALRYVATGLPGLRGYGKGNATLATIEDAVRRHTVYRAPEARLFLDEHFALEWELDDTRRKIVDSFLPQVREGSAVELDVRLSEPAEVRKTFALELLQLLGSRQVNSDKSRVRVLCAHKQGYCWLDEELKARLKQATVIRIAYRELEVQPDSVDSRKRWLEELYPIDEVLARDLGIPVDNITFHPLPPSSPHTYEVLAENRLGELVLREVFDTKQVVRPLFDAFPDYATATVSTGSIDGTIDGIPVLNCRVDTDYERFWDAYQSRVLPQLRDYVLKLHDGTPDPERAPHFGELRLRVELSEPDVALGVDQERLSTLEALHEDLYFETLLFFDVLGVQSCGRPLRYPGRIIPLVTAASGKGGTAHITCSGFDRPMPDRIFPNADPRVTAVELRSGESVVAVELTEGEQSFCWLLSTIEEPPQIAAQNAPQSTKPLVNWEQPISPAQCEHLLGQLSTFAEVRPFCAGKSILGQPVWAVDVYTPVDGRYVSQAKIALSKPCLFLTGRQHANEVSSTSHILKFIELLATSPEHRELLQRVNFIIQPITNPDGAALVDELYRQMPGSMLHAGYLGALGVDMTEGQWSSCPRYPEARVRADLWRMWRPDIVLNPHGYPSHEWVQLFAGYTAWVRSKRASARDWWIPRGWFVPHFDYINDERFPGHALAAVMLRTETAGAVDRVFGETNQRMYARYAKYTGNSLPLHDGVLVYMSPQGSAPDPHAPDFMKRYPQVTFFEGLSEAPDEIATGDWLHQLSAVGLEVTLVHARFLASMPREIQRTYWEEDGRLHLSTTKDGHRTRTES